MSDETLNPLGGRWVAADGTPTEPTYASDKDRHIASLESQNQALQERIETAARYVGKMNHTLSREGWHTSQHCARCDLEPFLSPTQETDLDAT